MNEFLTSFHFLRPEWLWGLLAAPALWWLQAQRQRMSHDWERAIDPALLAWLTPGQTATKTRQRSPLPIIILILSLLAMAGPSWEKKPQPVIQLEDQMVIVLDLSLSMLATDLAPNRLTRTKQKLQDLLNLRTEGFTALVVFSGDAHVVTPLTDDTNTIAANLPALDPYLMPVIGARPDRGVEEAVKLLQQAGAARGRIVLLTDGVEAHQRERIDELLNNRYTLHILATGTSAGGPVQLKDGQYLKDQGAVVIPKTDLKLLRDLADDHGGMMRPLALDDSDLNDLDIQADRLQAEFRQQTLEQRAKQFDLWEDRGYLLLLLIIPLALLARRSGALLLLLLMFAQPRPAAAFGWDDLWQTRDQQAQQRLQQGDAKAAAELYESEEHKAFAQARAGQYGEAAKTLASQESARAHYNRGNALAHAGQLEDAIQAYDAALEITPDMQDALDNKAVVEEMLKQQQEQQQQNQDQQQDSEQNQDSEQKQQNQDQQQDSQQNQQDQNQQQNQQQNGQNSEQNQQDKQDQAQQDKQESGANAEQDKQKQEAQRQQEEQRQREAQAQPGEESQDTPDGDQEEAKAAVEALSPEDKQSFEQWMRRVPDDPGTLLRNKFRHQATERNYEQNEEGEPLW